MSRIYLRGLPMPISINAAYENATVPGQRGRRKTKAYKDYAVAVEHWRLQNLKEIAGFKAEIQKNLANHNMALTIDYDFWFKRSSVLTIKGLPKRNDTSNRIKVLDDLLAPILGVDDSYFWNGKFSKFVIGEDHKEFVDVWVGFYKLNGMWA